VRRTLKTARDLERGVQPDTVLVAYGDLGVKSRAVRRRMTALLAENVARVLDDRGVAADVEARWARLLVHPEDPAETAAAARTAADVFGVVAARPCLTCEATLDAVVERLRAAAGDHDPTDSFAVRARRVGPDDRHDFAARDVEREGGAAVAEASGAPVDLDAPARTYRVEVREDTAFVSATEFEGPGGLPLGTQGRAVALVSGGIDSPVAAWETMRRGCVVVPLYVDLGDYGGPDHRARAVETVRRLRRYAPGRLDGLWVLPAGDLVADLAASVGPTRMLSLRRAMLAAAEALAERESAHSVVTGEAMGQKSSQTGPNLAVTDAAVSLPVHRPLLTRDKNDIVEVARRIGTFEDATLPVGCERVAPDHPETNATLAAVEAAEPADLLDRARALVADAEFVPVHSAPSADSSASDAR
jgi:thiamine biosynthesis protein ThiI